MRTITLSSRFFAVLAAGALVVAGCGDDDAEESVSGDTAADASEGASFPDDASVSIQEPAAGAEVTSPVHFVMVAEGFTVASAGESVDGEGHMHLLIDVDCAETGSIIPADDAHVHFGDGSVETDLELEPGEHTVCLQVGDGLHAASDLTDTVTFTVVEA